MKCNFYGSTLIIDAEQNSFSFLELTEDISEINSIIVNKANIIYELIDLPRNIKSITFKDCRINGMIINASGLFELSTLNTIVNKLCVSSHKDITISLSSSKITSLKSHSSINKLYMNRSDIKLLDSRCINHFKSDIGSSIYILDVISSPINIGNIAEYSRHSKPFIYIGTSEIDTDDEFGTPDSIGIFYDICNKKAIYSLDTDITTVEHYNTSKLSFLTDAVAYMV